MQYIKKLKSVVRRGPKIFKWGLEHLHDNALNIKLKKFLKLCKIKSSKGANIKEFLKSLKIFNNIIID